MGSLKSKIIIQFLCLCLFLFPFDISADFSLFKSCIVINNSFQYRIVDPDILEIANDKYWAYVGIWCETSIPCNAFSDCANGCDLYPKNYIKFKKKAKKVCEGDIIFVGNKKCRIGEIDKEPW